VHTADASYSSISISVFILLVSIVMKVLPVDLGGLVHGVHAVLAGSAQKPVVYLRRLTQAVTFSFQIYIYGLFRGHNTQPLPKTQSTRFLPSFSRFRFDIHERRFWYIWLDLDKVKVDHIRQ
jgi:hypothetical protein